MPTHVTRSEAETAAVARALGATLAPGAVVLLYGELGAGKTAFVRGLAEGLGADPDEVSSPTFTLVQEYLAGCRCTTSISTASIAPRWTTSASTSSSPAPASWRSSGPTASRARSRAP